MAKPLTRPCDEAECLPPGTPHPSRLRRSLSGFRNGRVLFRELRPLGKKPRHITWERNLVVVLMLAGTISLVSTGSSFLLSLWERIELRMRSMAARDFSVRDVPETSTLVSSVYQTGKPRHSFLHKCFYSATSWPESIAGTLIALSSA